jgi:hypothetical protein
MRKFRASMERFWDLKMSKYVEHLTRVSSEYLILLNALKACLIILGARPSASQLVACTVTSLPFRHGRKSHSRSLGLTSLSKCRPEL